MIFELNKNDKISPWFTFFCHFIWMKKRRKRKSNPYYTTFNRFKYPYNFFFVKLILYCFMSKRKKIWALISSIDNFNDSWNSWRVRWLDWEFFLSYHQDWNRNRIKKTLQTIGAFYCLFPVNFNLNTNKNGTDLSPILQQTKSLNNDVLLIIKGDSWSQWLIFYIYLLMYIFAVVIYQMLLCIQISSTKSLMPCFEGLLHTKKVQWTIH